MKKFALVIFLIIVSVNFVTSEWKPVTTVTNDLPQTWGNGRAIDACDSNTAIISVTLYSLPHPLYLTKDGGESWEEIFIPYNFGADDVSMVDSNHIWVTTSIGEIYATDDGGQTWDLQFYDQSKTGFMNYVEMFDLNNGVAMGDCPTNEDPALFLRTTDGGENWFNE